MYNKYKKMFEELFNKIMWENIAMLTFQLAIVFAVAWIISFWGGKLLKRTQKKEKANAFGKVVVPAISKPLKITIWLTAFTMGVEIVKKYFDVPIFSNFHQILKFSYIFLLAWVLKNFIDILEKSLKTTSKKEASRMDETTINAIVKLVKIIFYVSFSLVALQSLGFNINALLALGGAGGISIGFAAKDLLSNFFGALVIYLDKPFKVGDWIRSPDKEIEGTVEEIGWRITKVRTFEKRPLYIPNAIFTTIIVENPSRMSHRRIREVFGVRYSDVSVLDKLIKDVKNMLIKHKEIDESQTMIVNVDNYGDSSVDFFIYTFTHTTNWIKFHEIKQDVMLKIAGIVKDNGADFAFPTRTVHLEGASGSGELIN